MSGGLQLPSQCDVRNVAQLHAMLSAALAGGKAVQVDATAVEQCDTAAAQLLASAAREPNVTWRLSSALRAQLAELALVPGPFSEESP
jgi:anti-anti-sigma regulatory factor